MNDEWVSKNSFIILQSSFITKYMAEFTYTALTKDGHHESSTIQAPNAATAGHLLKEQGLLPVEISEKTGRSGADIMQMFSMVSFNEKIGFIENLGVMLKAGISITRCLANFSEANYKPKV